MKQAGLDTGKLDELMGSLGGAGGEGGMPSMEESMKMMSNMMNSPMIQEMMSDPERLEQSRQMILQNPMLKVRRCSEKFTRHRACVVQSIVSPRTSFLHVLEIVYDGRNARHGRVSNAICEFVLSIVLASK